VSLIVCSLLHPPLVTGVTRVLLRGAGMSVKLYIKFVFDCKKYGMKIMSKYPRRNLVRLLGKLQLIEEEKEEEIYIYKFITSYLILKYSNVPIISRFRWMT
jgi:hypothetical protein